MPAAASAHTPRRQAARLARTRSRPRDRREARSPQRRAEGDRGAHAGGRLRPCRGRARRSTGLPAALSWRRRLAQRPARPDRRAASPNAITARPSLPRMSRRHLRRARRARLPRSIRGWRGAKPCTKACSSKAADTRWRRASSSNDRSRRRCATFCMSALLRQWRYAATFRTAFRGRGAVSARREHRADGPARSRWPLRALTCGAALRLSGASAVPWPRA